MERQLTISECCEMISELAGDIDGVVYFLNCIREREKKTRHSDRCEKRRNR